MEGLSASGLRQDFFPAHEALPKEGWLLGGWFEQVREGDRLKEATVGFGSGSGQVSIEVVVSDLAGNPRQPFLCVGSENAKHRMPGGTFVSDSFILGDPVETVIGVFEISEAADLKNTLTADGRAPIVRSDEMSEIQHFRGAPRHREGGTWRAYRDLGRRLMAARVKLGRRQEGMA